ncbi:MAG: hypothetical protein ABIJ12_04700 [bacterium]
MKGNNYHKYFLVKLIFSLFIISLLTSKSVKSEDGFKPSDSIKFKLYYDNHNKKEYTHWRGGFYAITATGSRDNRDGYGGAFSISYDKLSPVTFRVMPYLFWTRFERIFPGEDILSLNIDLDLLVFLGDGSLRPYIGFGQNFYYNYWPTDEPSGQFEIGQNDDIIEKTIRYKYGSGASQHLRGGLRLEVNNYFSIGIDIKWVNEKAEMPVIIRYLNGEEREGTVNYKLNPITIYFGIAGQFKK